MANNYLKSSSNEELIGSSYYTVCHLHLIGFIESSEGKWIEALSDSGPIPKNRLVEVIGIDPGRGRVIVRKVKSQ